MRIAFCIGLFGVALVVGYLGYSAYTYHYAYTEQVSLIRRIQTSIIAAPTWRYGTITSVGQNSRTIMATLASGLSIQVRIPEDAYIGRQDLISENGVYTGALPPIEGTFADLQAGQHFAMILHKDSRGLFLTSTILVGNPI